MELEGTRIIIIAYSVGSMSWVCGGSREEGGWSLELETVGV